MTHHPYEAILASEVSEAAIASMAHMTDADIKLAMKRIQDHQRVPNYSLITGTTTQKTNATDLHAYRVELIRRRVVADQNTQSEAA